MRPGYAPLEMAANIEAGLAAFGIEMHIAERTPERFKDAGFVNVQRRDLKVPVGTWPKDETMKMIGMYCRSVVYDGLQAITMGTFTRGLKWAPEEVELFLIKVRQDLVNNAVHSYVFFHSFWAQKPVASTG